MIPHRDIDSIGLWMDCELKRTYSYSFIDSNMSLFTYSRSGFIDFTTITVLHEIIFQWIVIVVQVWYRFMNLPTKQILIILPLHLWVIIFDQVESNIQISHYYYHCKWYSQTVRTTVQLGWKHTFIEFPRRWRRSHFNREKTMSSRKIIAFKLGEFFMKIKTLKFSLPFTNWCSLGLHTESSKNFELCSNVPYRKILRVFGIRLSILWTIRFGCYGNAFVNFNQQWCRTKNVWQTCV